jgi:hypothetical protein
MGVHERSLYSNSPFLTAVIGSLAGAFAGAYGGYKIVERGKVRDDLLKEIRNTNAATMVSFGICNSLLATKQRLAKPLKEKYDSKKIELLEHIRRKKAGEIPDVTFEFQADFESFTLPPLAMDILQTQVFEKLSLVGRPLLLVTTLRQAIHTLEHALGTRNALIESYKAKSPLEPNFLLTRYFGLPYRGGQVKEEYPASLQAAYEPTDSVIFFSHLLCQDLGEHGDHISTEFTKGFGRGAPTIAKPDFTKAIAANLMPPAEGFSEWVGMFTKKSGVQTVD